MQEKLNIKLSLKQQQVKESKFPEENNQANKKTEKNSATDMDITSYIRDSVVVKNGSCPRKKYSLSLQVCTEYLEHHNGF